MFIDSEPTSLYSRTSDFEMESPAPQLPAFQSFVKRTPPPPNHEKPLPPVPDQPDRQTRLYLSAFPRRHSSIYSRTVSQYAPTPEPWENEDPALSDVFLQPSVYSLSTPELTFEAEPRARVRSDNLLSRRSSDPEDFKQEAPSNESLINEAQRLANDYHALCREQNKDSIKSPIQRRASASSNSVKESMEVVQRPSLFNPRQVSKQRAREYQRELNQQRYSPGLRSQPSLPVTTPEASVPPVVTTAAMAKRPSLFHSIKDHKRESKASKRREELKKTIKVIPGTTIPEMRSVTTPPKDMVQEGEWF